ncbi:hypothetical protein G7085_12790 [Tessaracoccus sp. HDW20]|uniref:hypothetical protein n=1 Tax=Tessaracoccus coleopterorum TaxID=2714950 RepID=UPI0018D2D6E4|nr:hypothetical protein [Tessaracoccus coleopterorum]NHB85202.1 hypothetical protein [Tessaracoccus coleopterorum]
MQAPEGFRTLAAEYLAGDGDGCTPEIELKEVNHAGFVIGTKGGADCGGAARVVWGDTGSGWAELFALQDVIACEEFATAGIPRAPSRSSAPTPPATPPTEPSRHPSDDLNESAARTRRAADSRLRSGARRPNQSR